MTKKTMTKTEKPVRKTVKSKAKPKSTAEKSQKSREAIEYERLNELYTDIPANKRSLVDGLIHQAARLRVQLDDLWEDLKAKGSVEPFQQKNGGVTFDRERPESKIFIQSDKNYLAIIKKLDEMLPAKEAKSGFSKLDD